MNLGFCAVEDFRKSKCESCSADQGQRLDFNVSVIDKAWIVKTSSIVNNQAVPIRHVSAACSTVA